MGNGKTELPPAQETKPTAEKRPASPEEQKNKAEKAASEAFEKENFARLESYFQNAKEKEKDGDYENALRLYEIILENIDLIKNINTKKLEEKTFNGAMHCFEGLINYHMSKGQKILDNEPLNLALPHFNNALKTGVRSIKLLTALPGNIKNKYPSPIQMISKLLGIIENKDTGFSAFLKNAESTMLEKKTAEKVSPLLPMRPAPQDKGLPKLKLSPEDRNNLSEFFSLKAELFGSAYPKRKSTIWQLASALHESNGSVAIEKRDKKKVRLHEDERKILGISENDPLAFLDKLTKLVSQTREITDESEAKASDKQSYILRREISEKAVILSSIFERIKNKDPLIVAKRWEIGVMTEARQTEKATGNMPASGKWETPPKTVSLFINGFDNLIQEWISGKKYIKEDVLTENIGKLLKWLTDLMIELEKYDDTSAKNEKKLFRENNEFKEIKDLIKKMEKENAEYRKFPEYFKSLTEQLQTVNKKDGWQISNKGEDSIDPRVEYIIYCHSINLYLNAIKLNPDVKDKYEALFSFLDKIGFGAHLTAKFRKEFEKIDLIKDIESKKQKFVDLYKNVKGEIESKLKFAKILSPEIIV